MQICSKETTKFYWLTHEVNGDIRDIRSLIEFYPQIKLLIFCHSLYCGWSLVWALVVNCIVYVFVSVEQPDDLPDERIRNVLLMNKVSSSCLLSVQHAWTWTCWQLPVMILFCSFVTVLGVIVGETWFLLAITIMVMSSRLKTWLQWH